MSASHEQCHPIATPSPGSDWMDTNQTLALWGIQENLLQWYRAIFLAFLSFLTHPSVGSLVRRWCSGYRL